MNRYRNATRPIIRLLLVASAVATLAACSMPLLSARGDDGMLGRDPEPGIAVTLTIPAVHSRLAEAFGAGHGSVRANAFLFIVQVELKVVNSAGVIVVPALTESIAPDATEPIWSVLLPLVPPGSGYRVEARVFNPAESTVEPVLVGGSEPFDVAVDVTTRVRVALEPLAPQILESGVAVERTTVPWLLDDAAGFDFADAGGEQWFQFTPSTGYATLTFDPLTTEPAIPYGLLFDGAEPFGDVGPLRTVPGDGFPGYVTEPFTRVLTTAANADVVMGTFFAMDGTQSAPATGSYSVAWFDGIGPDHSEENADDDVANATLYDGEGPFAEARTLHNDADVDHFLATIDATFFDGYDTGLFFVEALVGAFGVTPGNTPEELDSYAPISVSAGTENDTLLLQATSADNSYYLRVDGAGVDGAAYSVRVIPASAPPTLGTTTTLTLAPGEYVAYWIDNSDGIAPLNYSVVVSDAEDGGSYSGHANVAAYDQDLEPSGVYDSGSNGYVLPNDILTVPAGDARLVIVEGVAAGSVGVTFSEAPESTRAVLPLQLDRTNGWSYALMDWTVAADGSVSGSLLQYRGTTELAQRLLTGSASADGVALSGTVTVYDSTGDSYDVPLAISGAADAAGLFSGYATVTEPSGVDSNGDGILGVAYYSVGGLTYVEGTGADPTELVGISTGIGSASLFDANAALVDTSVTDGVSTDALVAIVRDERRYVSVAYGRYIYDWNTVSDWDAPASLVTLGDEALSESTAGLGVTRSLALAEDGRLGATEDAVAPVFSPITTTPGSTSGFTDSDGRLAFTVVETIAAATGASTSVEVDQTVSFAFGEPGAIGDPATSSVTLETVALALDAGFASIAELVPNQHMIAFDGSGGVLALEIGDGGGDMYDGGNKLSTDLSGLGSGFLSYTDSAVVASDALGTGGRYFTSTPGGMFVFAGDFAGADTFAITGNLGSDGGGTKEGFENTITVNGVTYKLYMTRNHSAGDPSINHLIIVRDNVATSQAFLASGSGLEDHRVTGLAAGGVGRLYYLLFASTGGAIVDDETFLAIAQQFISVVEPGN